MKKLLLALILCPGLAWAQGAVQQTGPVTKNSPTIWADDHHVRQGAGEKGDVAGKMITGGFGVVGQVCSFSATTDKTYHTLCIDGTTGTLVLNGVGYPVGGSYTINGTDVAVPSNVILQGTTGAPGQRAVRLGFYVPGDGGLAVYNWSTSNCAAADNGAQVQPFPDVTGCWVADFSGGAPSVQVWGATCDGATDDGVPINAALASAAKTVSGPDVGVCRSSVTVTVPGGSSLKGRNTASLGDHTLHPGGFTIKCDLAVSPCIKLDGGTPGNDHSALVNVGVDRVDGAVAASTVGVQLDGGMYDVVENVGIYRSGVGLWLYDRAGAYGVAAYLDRVLTCGTTGADIKIDGWREVRVNQSRFGCNGNLDVAHNEFVQITGGHGDGPNSVYFNNTQFNNGSGLITDCMVRWVSVGGGQNGPTANWVFSNVTVEQARSTFCSDSSLTNLNGLQVNNSRFYGGFVADASFFRLNAATGVNGMNFAGNQVIAWGDFTLNPPGMNGIMITGNEFITTGTGIDFTGHTGSTAVLSGNRWENMALRGDWGGLNVSGTGGMNTNTATGYVNLDIPGYNQFNCAANMALQFNGVSTGITYQTGTPICHWQRQGDLVTVAFYLALAAKGSAVGNATISGLPFTASFAPGVGSVTLGGAGMTSLTGPMYAASGAASKSIKLYKQATNDRGYIELTNADFTNASIVQGVLSYMLDAGPLVLPTAGP